MLSDLTWMKGMSGFLSLTQKNENASIEIYVVTVIKLIYIISIYYY